MFRYINEKQKALIAAFTELDDELSGTVDGVDRSSKYLLTLTLLYMLMTLYPCHNNFEYSKTNGWVIEYACVLSSQLPYFLERALLKKNYLINARPPRMSAPCLCNEFAPLY